MLVWCCGVHALGDLVSGCDGDVGEPGCLRTLAVLGESKGADDAADVAAALSALLGGELVVSDDVRDAQALG